MPLSKRLQRIADYVPAGSRVVDVGTDHGYIPLWLVENGLCASVIASDIREEPLKKAVNNARKAGAAEQIRFVLAAGLDGCRPEEVDVIIIAGMGGETILSILEAAPWAHEKLLILQPQTKAAELRNWLNGQNYAMEDASLVDDSGRIYLVWKLSAGEKLPLTPADLYVDPVLRKKRDPLLRAYVDGLIKKMRSKIQGLEKAAAADAEELSDSRQALGGFLAIREEWKNAEGK